MTTQKTVDELTKIIRRETEEERRAMSGIIYCPACKGVAGWSGTTNIGQYVGETCKCVNKLSYVDLAKERDGYKKAAEILLEALECANNQWVDDYLWEKFKLSEEMDKAKVIIDGLTKKAEAE
jgi:hypothetical protein